jgi:endonuclease/exonuclease/phosphatase family metal-dependent hydrolase
MRCLFLVFVFLVPFKQSKALTVLSYNIKNQENIAGLLSDVELFKQIDLLALQEVRLSPVQEDHFVDPFLKTVKKIWPYQCEERVNALSHGFWESQIILSRYKIQQCGAFDLEKTGEKKRIALWAQIEIEKDRPLLFINTDHETDQFQFSGFPDRQKQLKTLVQRLNHCQEWLCEGCQQWPTIVVGDFNTSGVSILFPWSTLGEVEQTIEYLKTAKLHHVSACEGHDFTFQSLWGHYELDHIFTKNILFECRRTIQESKGSDHLPIWAEMQGTSF